jgi:integrase
MRPANMNVLNFIDEIKRRPSEYGLNSEGGIKNLASALSDFTKTTGETYESNIMELLHNDFHNKLTRYCESNPKNLTNKRSCLKKCRAILIDLISQDNVANDERTEFQRLLSTVVEAAGGAPIFARAIGASNALIQRWLDGSVPKSQSKPTILRIETHFGMPAHALSELVSWVDDAKDVEAAKSSSSIAYRERHKIATKNPYRIKDAPELLRTQWAALIEFKTDPLARATLFNDFEDDFDNEDVKAKCDIQLWRIRLVSTAKADKKSRWYAFDANSNYVPTAETNYSFISAYLGFLTLSVERGGLGLEPSVIRLESLANQRWLAAYLRWRTAESGGAHGGLQTFMISVGTMLMPRSGFLRQPQFNSSCLPIFENRDWNKICDRTLLWSRQTLKTLRSMPKYMSRDPEEAARAILDLPNPLTAVTDMTERMRRAKPQTGGIAESIWCRNLLLMQLLASNPLRIENFATLSYKTDNTGSLRQHEDDSWWIHLNPDEIKNHAGAAKDTPYIMPIPGGTHKTISMYLKRYRHLLPGAESVFVFVGSRKTPLEPLEHLSSIVRMLTKKYLPECPEGIGPHVFRHFLATAILKARPGAWEDAAAALHDEIDTVKKNYAHLKGQDNGKRVLDMFASTFAQL